MPGYIEKIEKYSPAKKAGLKVGDAIISVDGVFLRDIIDWQWIADGHNIELIVEREDKQIKIVLQREYGEIWGIDFSDRLFDGVKQCANSCSFCFVNMLPKGLRDSLYVKDDDFRLSFLDGNYVTLTNLNNDDILRIKEQRLSPLNISLHCFDENARYELMGKNHAKGLKVFEEILSYGIEVNIQIVLLPKVNDGKILDDTLQKLQSLKKGGTPIISVGIVPLGYTKYSKFKKSYESSEDSFFLIKQVEEKVLIKDFVYIADEFYINAYGKDIMKHLPGMKHYGDFPQYQNGIGMLRTFIDEFTFELETSYEKVLIVAGETMEHVLPKLIKLKGLEKNIEVLIVKNSFFGGNINVSGLLTAQDLIPALTKKLQSSQTQYDRIVLPPTMFNHDGLSLDGYPIQMFALKEVQKLI